MLISVNNTTFPSTLLM